MPARIVMRWIAFGAPYAWFGFATRFKDLDGVVGKTFFKEFAESVKATFQGKGTSTGLMESMEGLRSSKFDPSKVNPLIREFYEHTSRFDMQISIKWNPLIRPFGLLYQKLIARKIQNLNIPFDSQSLSALDNWIELIDLESNNTVDYRCWIRVQKDSQVPVYIGAYKTFSSFIDDDQCCYISVSFPLPGGNLTTVLSPFNYDVDGLKLSTKDKTSTQSGVYFIFPSKKSFTMFPAFGLSEQFLLKTEDKDQVLVEHTCFWLGIRAFVMHYTITRMISRNPDTLRKVYENIKDNI